MTTIFPKQPGYYINHDPSRSNFKKVSSLVMQKIKNGEYKLKKEYNLPRALPIIETNFRNINSLSLSQSTYVNHYGTEPIKEYFKPDWVKLDKQVLRFNGYFKESVDESKIENSRVRRLTIYYYLVDDTIEIFEEKESNSGIPQGSFLKRSKIRKNSDLNKYEDCNSFFKFQNSDSEFYDYRDLIVGKKICFYGKLISINDCDQYTREFYRAHGYEQPKSNLVPIDTYHIMKNSTKISAKRDSILKDYSEHTQGGGKVKDQKQFLENDRRVLKFNASHDSLKYIINYYLADDTVEIKELFFHNSGRSKFPLFLKRNKLPKKFSVTQPGEVLESDYVTPTDIEVK
jgi:hypothetical protein